MENKDIAASLGYKLANSEEKTEEKVSEVKEEAVEEKKETPSAEETKEPAESSLDIKEEDNTSTEETTEEVVSQDFDTMLSERFEGKYKSIEELKDALEAKPETKEEQKYEDERLNTLLEFMNNGGRMEDFLSTQLTNYDEMSDIDLIKAEMKALDSDLTDEDINLLFSDRYKLDEEEFEEDLMQKKLSVNLLKSKKSI